MVFFGVFLGGVLFASAWLHLDLGWQLPALGFGIACTWFWTWVGFGFCRTWVWTLTGLGFGP